MSDYSWGIEDVENDIEKLRQLETDDLNNYMQKRFALAFKIANSIIQREIGMKFHNEDYLEHLALYISEYIDLYPAIDKFVQIKKSASNKVKIQKPKEIKLSYDDIMELVHLFYKQIPDKNLYRQFLTVFDSRKDVVKFEKMDDYGGMTYYIPILKKNYILIKQDRNNRYMLAVAVHEFAHAIASRVCSNRFLNTNLRFDETDALFFEMLSETFFAKELNNNGFIINQYSSINSRYAEAKALIDDLHRVNKLADKGILTTDDWYEKHPDKPFFENTSENIKYVTSFLYAIELLELYKKDKDKGLFVLNSLLRARNIPAEDRSLSFLKPGESFKNYHDRVLKRIKKGAK